MNTNGQSLSQFLQNHKELTVRQILHAHLRISTHTLNENKIRPLTDQESKPLSPHFWTSVTTVTPSIRKVNAWQFLNSLEPWIPRRIWEEKKDAEKRSRYAPVLEFFNSLRETQAWTMMQFNFTVGVTWFADRSSMWIASSLSPLKMATP